MQSAHFSQPKPEVPSPTGAPLTIETTKEIQNRKAFSWNETKKETPFCANLAELDKETGLWRFYLIFVVFSPSNSAGADEERWVRHVFKRTHVCDGSGCAANTR